MIPVDYPYRLEFHYLLHLPSYREWFCTNCQPSQSTNPLVLAPRPAGLTAPSTGASVGNVGGYSLPIYSEPGYDSKELYYYEEGAPITIEEGPVCVGKQLWWRISINGLLRGWAPETSESGDYLINP